MMHLQIEKLKLSIYGKEILRDVSLNLPRGSTLGLVGESGSGKSITSLFSIGLTPQGSSYSAVTARFTDRAGVSHDLTGLSEMEWQRLRGKKIAMIFQSPSTSLNPCIKIRDHFKEVLMESQKDWLKKARELMFFVGITDPDERLNAYSHQMSGGMCQRIMIALALSGDPELLLADEPTTALDVTIQAQILALLRKLQAELKMSMVFVSHDLRVISEVADRIAVMNLGEVVESGATEEVLRRPQHAYTKTLMDCFNWRPKV